MKELAMKSAEIRRQEREPRRRMRQLERAFKPVLLGAYEGGVVEVNLPKRTQRRLDWRHFAKRRAYFAKHPEAVRLELKRLETEVRAWVEMMREGGLWEEYLQASGLWDEYCRTSLADQEVPRQESV